MYQKVLDYHVAEILLSTIVLAVIALLLLHRLGETADSTTRYARASFTFQILANVPRGTLPAVSPNPPVAHQNCSTWNKRFPHDLPGNP
jgi:hypothetical protein